MIIQQGDITPWRLGPCIFDRARFPLPAGYTFTLYMQPLGAAVSADPKIDAGACTYTADDYYIYYAPEAEDVDTAGIFRVQLYATGPASLTKPLYVFEATIRPNIVPLPPGP